MRIVLAALAMFVLLVLGAGCGGNSCQDSCERVRSCAQNLDCTKATSAECQLMKASEGAYDCNSISQCEGTVKARWDTVATCTLDPTTCGCATK
jgi:hypothetical protein